MRRPEAFRWAWNLADHPELAQGGAAHVEQIRSAPDERYEDAIPASEPLMATVLLDTKALSVHFVVTRNGV